MNVSAIRHIRNSGHGVATGGPSSGAFTGHYHVLYFLETGEFSDEYDLDIKKHAGAEFYDVTWSANGQAQREGRRNGGPEWRWPR